jgi:hypothetical protein
VDFDCLDDPLQNTALAHPGTVPIVKSQPMESHPPNFPLVALPLSPPKPGTETGCHPVSR